jgi:soluble lytic murein transglycosylase-like protein
MATALQNQIAQEAANQGVPPAIALAVAQQESSFNPNARGAAGEIGLFQLMPATASFLGVNPSDVSQNISGGISFLAQLFKKYGSWSSALSAYNSGSPSGSLNYASQVLSKAANYGAVPTVATPASDLSTMDSSALDSSILGIDPNTLIIGGLVAAGILFWWLDD